MSSEATKPEFRQTTECQNSVALIRPVQRTFPEGAMVNKSCEKSPVYKELPVIPVRTIHLILLEYILLDHPKTFSV